MSKYNGRAFAARNNITLLIALLACTLLAAGCFGKDSGPSMPSAMQDMGDGGTSLSAEAPMSVTRSGDATYNGKTVHARKVTGQDSGYAIADGSGGVIWVQGDKRQAPDQSYANARELKLKVRELADQLLIGAPLQGTGACVAVPVSFVMQDDFERSSALGRFMAEQLYYELNQRGVPLQEYRMDGSLRINEQGELLLKKVPGSRALNPSNLYIVGTYFMADRTVFINAKLIRSNGQILRTGQLLMPANALTKRMMASGNIKLNGTSASDAGGLPIKDFAAEARPPRSLSPVDSGMDIH